MVDVLSFRILFLGTQQTSHNGVNLIFNQFTAHYQQFANYQRYRYIHPIFVLNDRYLYKHQNSVLKKWGKLGEIRKFLRPFPISGTSCYRIACVLVWWWWLASRPTIRSLTTKPTPPLSSRSHSVQLHITYYQLVLSGKIRIDTISSRKCLKIICI